MDGKDAMPTSARLDTRLTYADFVLFPDDGLRHEIIDGVHYVTPSPTRRHQRVSRRLSFALESYLSAHPSAGEMFYAPFDVVMSNWDVVEPDLLVIAGDQQDILTEKNVQGAPALVIEILSPGTRRRDEQIKRHSSSGPACASIGWSIRCATGSRCIAVLPTAHFRRLQN